ncbi:MAG: hypothetical protein ACOCXG_00240 [Nanoarchaeota archaeon]
MAGDKKLAGLAGIIGAGALMLGGCSSRATVADNVTHAREEFNYQPNSVYTIQDGELVVSGADVEKGKENLETFLEYTGDFSRRNIRTPEERDEFMVNYIQSITEGTHVTEVDGVIQEPDSSRYRQFKLEYGRSTNELAINEREFYANMRDAIAYILISGEVAIVSYNIGHSAGSSSSGGNPANPGDFRISPPGTEIPTPVTK